MVSLGYIISHKSSFQCIFKNILKINWDQFQANSCTVNLFLYATNTFTSIWNWDIK